MRILHCCLAAFYIDDFGYQENILPKIHKELGHEVSIVASTENYVGNTERGHSRARSYLTPEGIPITRLAYAGWLPAALAKKLRIYQGLTNAIEQLRPDVFFLHDCQFVSIYEIARYAKKHPEVRIYVDSHTDFINSARGWVSKNVLHKIVYRWCAKKIEPVTKKFYGTLPLRVDFLRDVYGISGSKVELLVLGADHSVVDVDRRKEIREAYRKKLGVGMDEFLLISGGKIDRRKNIQNLIEAVKSIDYPNVKLLLFGTPTAEMKDEISKCLPHESIIMLGWLSYTEISHYLLASDLAIFPGTHSVIWEQTVGLGVPCIFKRWSGIEHVDVGGNCVFIDRGDENDIRNALLQIVDSPAICDAMKKVAIGKGIPVFSYSEIAKRSIECDG
jgi:1,2-diacylglycerol 3-alpha-glucosyltransferase